MRRRRSELQAGDWTDVLCIVCHRPIDDAEWRSEDEYGTTCWDCHSRLEQTEDNPQAQRPRYRRHPGPLGA